MPKLKIIHIRVDEELHSTIKKRAEEKGYYISQFARLILKQNLAKRRIEK